MKIAGFSPLSTGFHQANGANDTLSQLVSQTEKIVKLFFLDYAH